MCFLLDFVNERQTVIFTNDEGALFETRLEVYDLPPRGRYLNWLTMYHQIN